MARTVLAFDLGTGGAKAAIYAPSGAILAEGIVTYQTFYPAAARHEQRPEDWWQAVRKATEMLLADPAVDARQIGAISLSGHSLGCVPVAADGALLQDSTPIWSDGRATAEAADFFTRTDEAGWYLRTGNGFPAPLYTLFKVMWLARNAPEVLARTAHIIGTKDYINYRLTGVIATDPSYASGSGLFDLAKGRYVPELAEAAGLSPDLFPPIVPSSATVGRLLPEVAASLGLPADVRVMAGGVDNACMALGARCFMEGDAYLSLGSSSWITVASSHPVLGLAIRPYVFAHVVPGSFISATSIFSSGTSVDWVRERLLPSAEDPEAFSRLAGTAPPGSRGLIFLPTLGGGTSYEGGPDLRGGFVGLDLRHGPPDIARAAIEGVAFGLRDALDALRRLTRVSAEIPVTGGGAKSALWRQVLADALECRIIKSSIDRQASTLGAAALGFIGLGQWPDAMPLRNLHHIESAAEPGPGAPVLARSFAIYRAALAGQRRLAADLAALRQISV